MEPGSRTLRTCVRTLLVAAVGIAACATLAPDRPGPSPHPSTAVPATSVPVPTALSSPTPTPVPTARPLIDELSEPGTYRNLLLGVSVVHPADWMVFEEDVDEYWLLSIANPEETLTVVLETEEIPEDQEFEEFNAEFFDWLQGQIGLRSVNWATTWTDTLTEERPRWHGLGEGVDGSTREAVTFEVVAAATGNRNFRVVLIGESDEYLANSGALDDIKDSFQVFSPRPYGIDRTNALFFASGEPLTLDPAKWLGSAGGIVGDIFSGLVQLGTDLAPVPDLAERWQISPDGQIYTFYLRQGVTFHDGSPMTAEDVKFSWERAASPETESNTAATYLGDIVGVSEVIAGEATEIRGVRVIDDHTLEVTLDAPKAYFLSKLAYPTSWIVDRNNVDQIEEAPNGTGPFRLVKYDEGEVIILERNPTYHRGFVPLEYVVYLIYPGPAVRLYESGGIDFVSIDEDLLDRANDPADPLYGTVQTVSELCTFYVLFDTSRPPFDDPLVRKAFAQAIDKERFNEIVEEGKGVIARGLFPPGLPGYDPDARPIQFDPVAALETLRMSTYGASPNLLEIVFTTSGAGSDLAPGDALLIEMWQEALGVTITVEQIDSRSFLDEIYAGDHGHLMFLGWCADYPDPENFADVLFHSESRTNHGPYSNAQVDEILVQARAETDIEARLELYRRVEQILIDDAAAVFIGHSRAYYSVMKPYVHNYVATAVDVAQLMNVSIERVEE